MCQQGMYQNPYPQKLTFYHTNSLIIHLIHLRTIYTLTMLITTYTLPWTITHTLTIYLHSTVYIRWLLWDYYRLVINYYDGVVCGVCCVCALVCLVPNHCLICGVCLVDYICLVCYVGLVCYICLVCCVGCIYILIAKSIANNISILACLTIVYTLTLLALLHKTHHIG